jgi:Nif11 domain
MSEEGFEQFHRLVLEDVGLQERLRESDDLESFLELILQLGEERGCRFTAADVEAALRKSRRAWLERWIEK